MSEWQPRHEFLEPKRIKSETFIQALIDAGIITQKPDHHLYRVTIDATVGQVVQVHIQCHGDERLLLLPGLMEPR